MRTWLKLLIASFLIPILLLAGLIFLRKPVFVWFAQSYFAAYNVELLIDVEEISWNRIAIKNLTMDSKNKISNISLGYSLFSDKIFSLRSLNLDVETLDLLSLQKTLQKMTSQEKTKTPLPSFAEGLDWCRQIQEMSILVTVREIMAGQKAIPLDLKTQQKNETLHISWNAPSLTRGEMHLQCKEEAVSLQIPHLSLSADDIILEDLQIKEINFDFSKAFLRWSKDSSLQGALSGRWDISLVKDKKAYSLRIPSLLISAQSHFENPQKIEFRLKSEKLNAHAAQMVSVAFMELVNNIDLSQDVFKVDGQWTLKDLSVKDSDQKQWLVGLHSKGEYSLSGKTQYQLKASVSDRTGSLQISNLRWVGDTSAQTHTLFMDSKKTVLKLKSETLQLFPFLKDFVQKVSGQISLGGELQSKNQNLDGRLDFLGRDIAIDSEWGNIEGVDFKHSLLSLKNFSSPPGQFLKIKKITVGQSFEDLALDYQVANLKKVNVAKFSMGIDKARLNAQNFSINLEQKRIENFSVQVVDLDLERVLAIGLKDTVKAQGRLHGNVDLTFEGSKPVLSGLLKDTNKGWIQYRTGTTQASKTLSVSDGPMDILNNYLYDFQYENLSLTISSNKSFDMKMKLSTLGRNPNYLGGKPLLLNVNLEQNVLAAMQSMMLTYDLPSRLKERLEKVEP